MSILAKSRGFAVFILLFSAAIKIEATTLLEVEFDDVVEKSQYIFEGKVVAKEIRRSKRDGSPFTYVTFQVLDVLKGDRSGKSVMLGFSGGSIDGKNVFVHGLRMPEMNERGIYFVESLEKELFNPLYGWHQGHYLVIEDTTTGVEYVTPVLESGALLTGTRSTDKYAVPTTKDLVAPTIGDFKGEVRTQLEDAQ